MTAVWGAVLGLVDSALPLVAAPDVVAVSEVVVSDPVCGGVLGGVGSVPAPDAVLVAAPALDVVVFDPDVPGVVVLGGVASVVVLCVGAL